MLYIFEKSTDFDNIFGEDPDRLQVFFAHVFSSIEPVFKKLQVKFIFSLFQNGSYGPENMRKKKLVIGPDLHQKYYQNRIIFRKYMTFSICIIF